MTLRLDLSYDVGIDWDEFVDLDANVMDHDVGDQRHVCRRADGAGGVEALQQRTDRLCSSEQIGFRV